MGRKKKFSLKKEKTQQKMNNKVDAQTRNFLGTKKRKAYGMSQQHPQAQTRVQNRQTKVRKENIHV